MKKIIVLILVFSVVFSVFSGCSNRDVIIENNDEYKSQKIVYDFFNSVTLRNYSEIIKNGKLIYESDEPEKTILYDIFTEVFLQSISEEGVSVEKSEEETYVNNGYNCYAWCYLMSYLYDENGNVKKQNPEILFQRFDAVFPNMTDGDKLTKKHQQAEVASTIMPKSTEILQSMLNYLTLYSLSRNDCDISEIYDCISSGYSYLRGCGVENLDALVRFYLDVDLYQNANISVSLKDESANGLIDNISKENAVAAVDSLTQNNELGYDNLVKHFNVKPKEIFNGKYIIRMFIDDDKLIVFYGEPVNSACIVDKQTGELLYNMLYDRDIILERAKALKDN